jgi:hypothetical protein
MNCQIIFDQTRLAIEKGVCTDISKIVSQPRKKDEEIEVRFGYLVDGRNKSGLSSNGVESRTYWYTLYKLLSSSELYQSPTQEKSLVEVFGSLRKITNLGIPGNPLIQDKKKTNTIDFLSFQVRDQSYYVRLSTATEIHKPGLVTSGKPDYQRIRTRRSFISKDSTHRFDLTFASSNGTGIFEVEIEFLGVVDLPSFFKPIKLVVHILKGVNELVTLSEFSSVIKAYNSFFLKEARFDPTKFYRRGLPQPVNLKRHHLKQMNAYASTNKLNGTRMVGLFSDGDFFLINMVGQVLKLFSNTPKLLDNTLIDLEYFKGIGHGFDLLFLSDKDVRGSNLDVRLKQLEEVIQAVNRPTLIVKKFFMTGDLYKDTLNTFSVIDQLSPEDNDGIIYTPITEPYFNSHIYKWKPPEQLTIDFQAIEISVSEHKYNLQVKNKADKLQTFNPPGFSGTIISKQSLKGVGEYQWLPDRKTFSLVRARPDKDVPNFIDIAQDVWEDIQNPLTKEKLLETLLVEEKEGEDRDALRKFNNSVKRELIQKYLPEMIVLDLGAGRGGDLGKYAFSKIKKLYAVEPNKVHLNELIQRAEAMKQKHQLPYTLVPILTNAQSTTVIAEELREKVGASTMFFSLSFFFENKLLLSELIKTLVEFVDKDGYFIGTTIDGMAVRTLLEGKDSIVLGDVKIQKRYTDFTGPIGFNKATSFVYGGSKTVKDEQIEFLVDWDLLVREVREVGFVLEKSELFSLPDWMNEEEATVAKLYRTFVFKRNGALIPPPQKMVRPIKKSWPMASAGANVRIQNSVILSDLKKEGFEYDLVRTGTHDDGNCFFHAILTSLNTDGFRKKNKANQKEQTISFRKSIKVSEQEWMALNKGNLARIGASIDIPGFDTIFHSKMVGEGKIYIDNRINILKSFFNDNKQLNKWAVSLGANKRIQNLALPQYIPAITDLFNQEIRGNLVSHIDRKDIEEKAMVEFNKIVGDSVKQAYTNFTTLIGSCGKWVGQEVLMIVSDIIDRDIYIMESYDGDVYKTECAHVKNRTSIILLYQGGVHYESVARVLPGNVVQPEFVSDDPIITLFKKKVC